MTLDPQQRPGVLSHARPGRRRRSVRILLLTGGLIILIAFGGVAWWLISPLFFHSTSSDANPFAHTPAAASTSGTTSTPVPTGPVTLATGAFIDNLHAGTILAHERGSGNVTIGKAVDGRYLIHLNQLDITNGPDLHVYLAPTGNSIDAGQVMREGVDLGSLVATEGSLNVTIPTDVGVNLTKYNSVAIVCKLASTIFTLAPLAFSAGS